MKRLAGMLVLVVVVAATTSSAFAQDDQYFRRPHRVAISMDGGLGTPSKPVVLKDLWNTGWPFTVGVSASVFSWLEVGGGFTYARFGISESPAKSEMDIVATSEITGGDISVMEYYGTARFVAIPNERTNPYAEIRVGAYKVTASDLEVAASSAGPTPFPAFSNSMPDAKGIHVAGGAGLRYALTDYWTAYTHFVWSINLGDTFAPGDLVLPRNAAATEGDVMQFGSIIVGVMIRM